MVNIGRKPDGIDATNCEPRRWRHKNAYWTNAMGSFTSLNYHIIFGTRYRKPTISDSVADELYRYCASVLNTNNGIGIQINGTTDHVHILCSIAANTSVADIVRLVKSNSSKWMNEQRGRTSRFQWQTGYAAFTVSYSNIDVVRRYVQNQQEHHAKRSFRDEYIAFLKKHNVQFDMKYLFEDEHVG